MPRQSCFDISEKTRVIEPEGINFLKTAPDHNSTTVSIPVAKDGGGASLPQDSPLFLILSSCGRGMFRMVKAH